MPASEILALYRAGKLHSGRGKHGKKGKIVRSKAQARAIQISYARKEGHDIPEKPSRRKRHNKRTHHKKVTVKR